jgi:hypothetical protein
MELRQLGLSVRQGVLSAGINVIPRMVDQSEFRTIYAAQIAERLVLQH